MTDATDPSHVVSVVRSAWPPPAWGPLHVGVAVSGGADSMALLRCLDAIHRTLDDRGRLYALHVDHQLRGEAAAADAEWVVQECESLGIEPHVLKPRQSARGSDLTDGMEAYSRRIRYHLLGEACEKLGARYLAAGHTADDQAETVLLRILRGAGLRGAAGIPFTRPLTPSVSVVRPLLACSRKAILSYLAEVGQEYRRDETNNDLGFRRNLIRHEWLPKLETVFPDASDALRRLAEQCRETQAVIESLAEELLALCELSCSKSGFSLAVGPLNEADEPLARETLRLAWREAGLGEQGMTRRWWCELALQGRQRDERPITLPGGYKASVEGNRLIVSAGSG
ncbi:MAG: tRNA lysidine(34) synthetase TilS [Planctomycetota bacterium]